MLHYILQTIVFQLLFLMVYDVFLKKETFFNWNRFYLLASAFLSVALPFIKIESFKTVIPEAYVFSLPEVIIGNTKQTTIHTTEALASTVASTSGFTFSWSYLLYFGSFIAVLLFVFKLSKLLMIAYKNPKIKFEKAFLVELANSKHAFSFFNYIFIGKDINAEDKQSILTHELQHVNEKHSIDLLFFEILKILFWFNPLIYMYQSRITNLHEFIADSKAVKSSNKVNYYQNLLSQVFDTQKISFINPFFKQSLIKKRIIMLSKSKSKQIHLAKYLLVFPMVIGMLFYTSCSNEEKVNESVEEVSNVSEEELVEKYVNELRELKKENKNIFDINSDGFEPFSLAIVNDNYINNLDNYARSKAFMLTIYDGLISKKDGKDVSSFQLMHDDLKTSNYKEYLERKKTQESIDRWENSPREYQLRKHVKDLDNITAEEQKLINSQVAQIKSDEYLREQIISDGLRHKKVKPEQLDLNFKIVEEEPISFVVIDQVPVFPGCDASTSNNEQRKCFSDKINKIVGKNWDLDLGKSLGLKGKQRIYARFTINKEGNIVNIKTRGPHPALEEEALRVVKLIPQLIPGKQNGNLVNVTFDLPIQFNITE